ncbi:methyltransferase [Clostridium sp. D53t1_180928_C8]|uniref:methyltransferase n=1 Tax=Clostridium sp. D53t1_180928_C8 TaxID=2787101 RepID=UPI0018AB9950|nr:methyltransferase [Clostridium sp. D53t1_180928_C8]
MNDIQYEKLLNIKTTGEQQGFYESHHYNRYEATSYLALDSLFKQYTLNSCDHLIDFGCGKGRLAFYINYYYNSFVTGIEMNNNYYDICENNKKNYFKTFSKSKDKIQFLNIFAEDYKILPQDNKFYFFNPFSIQLFIKVLNNILISVEENPREIDLIFYYPSEEYIDYLENYTALTLKQEIPVHNLYLVDKRQKFCIYTLNN